MTCITSGAATAALAAQQLADLLTVALGGLGAGCTSSKGSGPRPEMGRSTHKTWRQAAAQLAPACCRECFFGAPREHITLAVEGSWWRLGLSAATSLQRHLHCGARSAHDNRCPGSACEASRDAPLGTSSGALAGQSGGDPPPPAAGTFLCRSITWSSDRSLEAPEAGLATQHLQFCGEPPAACSFEHITRSQCCASPGVGPADQVSSTKSL